MMRAATAARGTSRIRARRNAIILGLLLALGGGPALAEQAVTYLLPAPSFLPAFAPWMLAKERGYYRAEGLNVDFEIGKGGADVAKQVGIGNAVLGGGMGDTPIIVRANGVPVKAVAVLGGGGLMQLVFHADSPIRTPADLKGKTVTVSSYQETTYYALLGMLAHDGLTRSDVDIEAAGATNVWKLFLAGKADAMAAVPDWIVDVEKAGARVKVIPSEDYFPSMAQAVLASDTAVKQNGAMIRGFVRATLRGMHDMMSDPDGAARDYVKAVPERAGQEVAMAQVFRLYDKYVYRRRDRLGEMDAKRFSALQDFYLKEGIIQKTTPVADLFTNQFVR